MFRFGCFNCHKKKEKDANIKTTEEKIAQFESIKDIFKHAFKEQIISTSAYNRFINPPPSFVEPFSVDGAIVASYMDSKVAQLTKQDLIYIRTHIASAVELSGEIAFKHFLLQEVEKPHANKIAYLRTAEQGSAHAENEMSAGFWPRYGAEFSTNDKANSPMDGAAASSKKSVSV